MTAQTYFLLAIVVVQFHSGRTQKHVQAYQACITELQLPSAALLFIAQHDVHFRELWRTWLMGAERLIPTKHLYQMALGKELQDAGRHIESVLDTCRHAVRQSNRPLRRQFLFTMYLHNAPSSQVEQEAALGDEQIPDRVVTKWGSTALVEAMRHLWVQSLKNPLNSFFVLVSDSSIPLYSPLVTYHQLVTRTRSAVATCTIGHDRFYRHKPELNEHNITRETWRYTEMWMGVIRDHAELLAEDNEVVPAVYVASTEELDGRLGGGMIWQGFKDHCPEDSSCIADEHYAPTLLAARGQQHRTDCTGRLHYVFREGGDAPHPRTFERADVTVEQLRQLRAGAWEIPATCGFTVHQPPTIRRQAFTSIYMVNSQELVQGIERNAHQDWAEPGATGNVLPEVCPLFARKFAEDTETVLLSQLSHTSLAVLPISGMLGTS